MTISAISRRQLLTTGALAATGLMLPAPTWSKNRVEVHGFCAPEFSAVQDVLQKSFDNDEDIGANVAVTVDGELAVNLWGGYRDPGRREPWTEDTLVCTMSVSKGITALAAHILIDRGQLDVNERVAAYWPEFAQAGKENITVKQLLSHLAALPIAKAAPVGAALDWDALARGLELQAPVWEPGTKGSYHATTYGNLIGMLVERASGRKLADFVREEIAIPVGAEFIFGCNDAQQARVAPPIPNPNNHHARRDRSAPLALETYRLLGENPQAVLRSPDFCRYIFPSASGISNAQSLARIFGVLACGGSAGGVTYMRPEILALVTAEQWFHPDPIHHDPYRVAMGLLLNGGMVYYGPNRQAFGTAGSGGYTVFADPERRISFAYTPNRFTTGHGLGIESRRLVDAMYSK